MTKTVVQDPISPDLKQVLRRLKLGKMLDTLPERLTLAKQQHLSHAAFLELVLADEATRRDTTSAARRAHTAGLDPGMRIDTWDDTAAVRYDHTLWNELTSLRFLDGPHGAVVLGPVGVGKTHLATALGHIAVRRRVSVLMLRADAMFKRLKAARLDNSVEAEMRRLAQVQLLLIDDFALQPLDATETADFYELVVARHHTASTVTTSNREPDEWLTMMSDPPPGPIRRRQAHLHRARTRHRRPVLPPTPKTHTRPLTPRTQIRMLEKTTRWSHPHGNSVVPSSWQMTGTPGVPTSCVQASGVWAFWPGWRVVAG